MSWLDNYSTTNTFRSMYINGFIDISGGRLQTRSSTDGHLLIAGDASLNGNLYVGGDISWNPNNLADNSIPSSAIIGGAVGATGPAGPVGSNTEVMLFESVFNPSNSGQLGITNFDYKIYGSTDMLADYRSIRSQGTASHIYNGNHQVRVMALLFKPGVYRFTLSARTGSSDTTAFGFDLNHNHKIGYMDGTEDAFAGTFSNNTFGGTCVRTYVITNNTNFYYVERTNVAYITGPSSHPQMMFEKIGNVEASGNDDTLAGYLDVSIINTEFIQGGLYWDSNVTKPTDPNEYIDLNESGSEWIYRIDPNTTSSVEVASFHSNADLSLNKRLFVGEDVSLNGNLYVGGDISWNPTSLANDSIPSSAIIGGGGGSSVWTTNNSNIYFSSGNVGIGTSTPTRLLHIHKSQGGGTLELSSTNTMMYLGTNDSTECYVWVDTDDDLKFGTNQTERLRIKNNGNVGIGTTNPSYLFHVNGTARVTTLDVAHGNCTIRANDGHFVRIYISNGYTSSELGRLYFRGTEGGKDTITLHANGFSSSSDDRLKAEEQKIENATETIMKLFPQKYRKYGDINHESGGNFESGLIVQDIWYNAPELRHMITLPTDGSGNEAVPLPLPEGVNTTHDIQNDPDYASLGWTETETASLDYTQLISYLIKSNQEQQHEIETLKAQNAEILQRL